MRQVLTYFPAGWLVWGGVAYSDGQFDDARLNLLLALTAESSENPRTRCRVVELETGQWPLEGRHF